MSANTRRTEGKKQGSDPALPTVLLAQYEALIARSQIKDDAAQRRLLTALENLRNQLISQEKPGPSGLRRLFKPSKTETPGTAQSLYVWGNVGRGKSMLMDLFFNNTPVEKKRRVHFHAFMQEVHQRMHALRQDYSHSKSGTDPVATLAQHIAEQTKLLCFDELQANDVADATLLYRLFDRLFESGVVIVSTSNHPPRSLYTGGIQRERFDKFIALIEQKMDVLSLESEQDYRHAQPKSAEQRYFQPLGAQAEAGLAQLISRWCGNKPQMTHATLQVHGRSLPFTLYNGDVGRFSFHELCENALGAADYLAIAQRLRMLILTDIPALPPEKRNEAKRFVTLIDALYEHKVKLACTAQTPPEGIYKQGDGSFEFARTVSRLSEMQSLEWGKLS